MGTNLELYDALVELLKLLLEQDSVVSAQIREIGASPVAALKDDEEEIDGK